LKGRSSENVAVSTLIALLVSLLFCQLLANGEEQWNAEKQDADREQRDSYGEKSIARIGFIFLAINLLIIIDHYYSVGHGGYSQSSQQSPIIMILRIPSGLACFRFCGRW
jgi:hypothetical protein